MSPTSYLQLRLATLRTEHAKLKKQVANFRGDSDALRALKKQKLAVKDQIVALERSIEEVMVSGQSETAPASDDQPDQADQEEPVKPSPAIPPQNPGPGWGVGNDRGNGNFDVTENAA